LVSWKSQVFLFLPVLLMFGFSPFPFCSCLSFLCIFPDRVFEDRRFTHPPLHSQSSTPNNSAFGDTSYGNWQFGASTTFKIVFTPMSGPPSPGFYLLHLLPFFPRPDLTTRKNFSPQLALTVFGLFLTLPLLSCSHRADLKPTSLIS